MFRRRREERLEKEGVRAAGVVVEARQSHFARQGNLGVESDTEPLVHLRVRVEPEGEPPFEVEKRLWIPLTQMPSAGSHVTVLYDPADHGRFSIHPQSGGEVVAAAFESFKEHSGFDPGQLFGGDDRLTDVIDQAVKNPRGAAEAVRAALDQPPGDATPETATGPGQSPSPAEAMKQAESWMTLMGQYASASPQPAPDRIEQLTKLAKLRENGALTEAEFQAEKRRLLGES